MAKPVYNALIIGVNSFYSLKIALKVKAFA